METTSQLKVVMSWWIVVATLSSHRKDLCPVSTLGRPYRRLRIGLGKTSKGVA